MFVSTGNVQTRRSLWQIRVHETGNNSCWNQTVSFGFIISEYWSAVWAWPGATWQTIPIDEKLISQAKWKHREDTEQSYSTCWRCLILNETVLPTVGVLRVSPAEMFAFATKEGFLLQILPEALQIRQNPLEGGAFRGAEQAGSLKAF